MAKIIHTKKEILKKPTKKLALKKLVKKIASHIKKPLRRPASVKVVKKPTPTPTPKLKPKIKSKEKIVPYIEPGVTLEKYSQNPIIEPSYYPWESKATFNPGAFLLDDVVHIVYRAVGDNDVSVLGYAQSSDGMRIEERPTYFIYKRAGTTNYTGLSMDYISGGGWNGGCEDPRLTVLDDTLYMLYTAFDGWGSVRIAMTSILISDFKKKKWNWKPPVLISLPGEINKNWVLFPEKINGKFAILHSFYPKIRIDYLDDLAILDGKTFIKSNNTRPIDYTRTWDSWFRGVGPSPIKIKEGWLVIYHAMDHNNSDRYRMGALILDEKDPTKILYRSHTPILEPEEDYENNGHKWGVIYSCGAVIKNEILYVYYGGADKFVCVASIPLKELIESLMKERTVKLKNKKVLKLK